MSCALVIANVIQSEGQLPLSARRLDNQNWVMGLADATVALQQACGYFAVVDVARPADTPTTTFDRSVVLLAGVPTVTWTERPKTPGELTATTEANNRQALSDGAAQHLANLRTIRDSAGTLTALQLSNAVRALADAQIAAGRYLFDRLDAIN